MFASKIALEFLEVPRWQSVERPLVDGRRDQLDAHSEGLDDAALQAHVECRVGRQALQVIIFELQVHGPKLTRAKKACQGRYVA